MSQMNTLYLGQGGHLHVMAELLSRGWNVAIPQVDRGDDIFVVKDENGELNRVQVKTRNAKKLVKGGYSATFRLKTSQLRGTVTPVVVYVFVMRHGEKWHDFIVIDQPTLHSHHENDKIGTLSLDKKYLSITIKNKSANSKCSGEDFSSYVNNWDGYFPKINH